MRFAIALTALLVCMLGLPGIAAEPAFVKDFHIDKADLSSTGANPYFILEPGYQLFLKSANGELTITVLAETKKVDGVVTRIVEERESEDGKLVEVSRNYFATSKKDKTVYYFGEDVDMYNTAGKITGHGGSWLAGVNGAKPGVMMPGEPKVGDRFYQELAPKVAMDRAEVLSLTETLRTPAGTLKNVQKTLETTPVEPGTKEYKFYARGIGIAKDGDLLLARHGYVKK